MIKKFVANSISFPGPKYYISDKPDTTHENISTARKNLGEFIGQKNMVFLNQTHSNFAIYTTDPFDLGEEIEADGMVTNSHNLALCIQTADCVPLLFYDENAQVIGACHAGWKGALKGVVQNTLSKMSIIGAKIEDISCYIGPCIRQESYEVDTSFREEFLDQSPLNQEFFKNSIKTGHFMFDLPGYVKTILNTEGIKKIDDSIIDTYTNQDYFSYRRSCHLGKKLDGNIISAIYMAS